MTGEVVLSSALRSNLLSLQRTQSSIDKVQNVLATGLKVSSALDNPQSFFASQALKNRSSDLTRLLDGIGQSIQTIKAADAGVTSLTKLVGQAQSIVDSAREAVTSGAKEASVTGNADLSGVTDLTTVPGIPPGGAGAIVFDAVGADGLALTLSASGIVVAASGDSIEQLVTKINDLTDATGTTSDTNGQQLIQASIDSDGHLKLTGLHGVSFNVTFDSDADGNAETAANGAADNAFAAALGFGSISKAQARNSVTLFDTGFTASNNTKLTSGEFFKNGATSGYADASDLLTSVETTEGGGTARFSGQATNAGSIEITINDKAVRQISLSSTQTIQGLVDGINNDSVLGGLIEAAYDSDTGQFTIEATSATVNTLKIGVLDGTNAAVTDAADFDFGIKGTFAPGVDLASSSENFVLASAASTLSQYEADYNQLRTQIDELVSDAGYRGINLVNGDTLDTFFNEDRSNKLSTVGTTLTSAGLGLSEADFSTTATIEAADSEARGALSTLRSFGGTLSNSLSIIQTREDFTKNLVNTLNEGSDKLTLADQNEEGAKLLALQTRQQLGVTALSLAAQAQQSVLRLF